MYYLKKITALFLSVCLSQIVIAQSIIDEIFQELPEVLVERVERVMGKTNAKAKVVSQGIFAHSPPYREVYSPGTSQFAGTLNGSLYLRNEDSDSIQVLAIPKNGWYWHIENAMWSPDGKYIAAKQINDQGVPTIRLTHENPDDVSIKTYSRAGEIIPMHQFYIVNAETGKTIIVEQDADFPYIHLMTWSRDNKSLYFIQSNRLMKQLDLLRVDAKTGNTTTILTEKSDTYLVGLNLLQGFSDKLIRMGLVTFLEDRDQFIWMSERTGFKQLYLYSNGGTLIRPLTNDVESGILENITEIDAENNWVYYAAHSDMANPYLLQIFKTSLQKDTIEKLVEKKGVFDAFLSAGKDSLYVVRSSLPALLQLDIYTAEGDYLFTPWEANTEKLKNGYLNIEYVKVLTADNKTTLTTMILKPSNFDPNKKYPVVEYIYGGNFANIVPQDLWATQWVMTMRNLAQVGFIVVFIDGRGTPMRGKSFQDFSYGKFGQIELQDHISAIKQLGKDRPYMNMNKIGVIGLSWGGHFALRALVEAPDFYKAGHINAAPTDPINFRVSIEPFMGCLPQDCPEKYEKSNISKKLENLEAPLMIVHGTADDDVPIEEAYRLVEKLEKLEFKKYEFVEYQGTQHYVNRNPEWENQMINFFVKKLK